MVAPSRTAGAGKLRQRLERALARPEPAVQRLSSAGTSVSFRVAGADAESVTVLLDRRPPEVAGVGEPAEIEIALTPEQAGRFADGELVLSLEILDGEVACRGPVRKYLVVDAILRRLLARARASETHGG